MKKTLLLPFILILITGLQLSSCKKKEEKQTTKLTITVKLDGDTVEGALVVLNDDDLVEEKTTDSHGKVVFDDLDPGIYQAEAGYTDTEYGIFYYGADEFEISKGQNKKVTIVLTEW